jgi:hypothetical protein
MCDYSLHRPAKIADKLVTSKFAGTISRGFAAVGEPNVAVCLLPGTEIAFDKEVKYGGFLFSSNTGQKTAVFRQINQHEPASYHDMLEFADGQTILLSWLRPGQHATVLQLPVSSLLVTISESRSASPVMTRAEFDRLFDAATPELNRSRATR